MKQTNIKSVLILFLAIPILSFAQSQKITWDYLVKPGSEEWRYSSYAEKLQKNQPPMSLMNKLTTTELLELCMEYPFNMDILLFNNPNVGISKILKESTCWQEYLKREDALSVLLNEYEKRPASRTEISTDKRRKNKTIINTYFLEKIISESSILNNADLGLQKLLLTGLIKKHEGKKSFPNRYAGYTYYSTLSAIVKVLDNQDLLDSRIINKSEYYNLVERGMSNDKDLEINILNEAKYIIDK